jgi:hypothetical protein
MREDFPDPLHDARALERVSEMSLVEKANRM